ncbi:MAG: Smr/MutS family protein [Muribaculaceae bacterium]|nr:Smr/MutS family protein [Muribaculaceae bacterium]
MIYPSNFEQKIGFDTIRHEIEKRCICSLGYSHAQDMHFSTSPDTVMRWLQQTNEFLAILQSKKEFPLNHFFDLRPTLKAIGTPGSFIAAESLFNLQRSLTTIAEILKFFRVDDEGHTSYPALKALATSLQSFPEIVNAIGAILDKTGNVKDNASPHLSELRATLAHVQASISGTLRRIIAQGRQEGILDNDVQPSVRDGRLVLPVAPMYKRKVRGIVHDESASGKTVFIEPEEIVEANNRIRETEAEIAREIIRILTEITDMIRPHSDELLSTYETLGVFDFVRAKALFATEVGGQLPHIGKQPHIEWFHAIHPALLLALREQGKEVVPLSITLDSNQRILLISGPNAGGKSVCLKTVGVVQYMMQCGVLPTVYDNSHMGFFSNIFIDIGDQQSIEDDLSTYSSHLQNMKTFITRADKHSLVLIDEFGSGTEPQIGGAIAQAILEKLNLQRTFGVITTHYQNLKHFADETQGIVNGAMLYDRQHMQPLFQLSIGYPGSSFAIEIARKIGLAQDVIDKASDIVGSDYINMDRYLLDIVRDRRYWENKRHEIRIKEKRLDTIINDYEARMERLADEHRAIIREAKDEARNILSQSNAQIEHTIREIREIQAEKEKTKEIRQQLEEFKQRLEKEGDAQPQHLQELRPKHQPRKRKTNDKKNEKTATTTQLQVGDNVLMKGSTTVGTIMSVDEKYALVAFGNLKTRVETTKLERTMRQAERKRESSVGKTTSDEIRARQLHFKPDIDVRGMRVDEALQAVTYFIDDAIQFNHQRVRILHGTGTGVLREVIRQYLSTVAGVKSYRDEHVQFGGAGITVVDLE